MSGRRCGTLYSERASRLATICERRSFSCAALASASTPRDVRAALRDLVLERSRCPEAIAADEELGELVGALERHQRGEGTIADVIAALATVHARWQRKGSAGTPGGLQ